MGHYLASQIIDGKLTYEIVMNTKWGKRFKDDIDKTLDERGHKIAEDGTCVLKQAAEAEKPQAEGPKSDASAEDAKDAK